MIDEGQNQKSVNFRMISALPLARQHSEKFHNLLAAFSKYLEICDINISLSGDDEMLCGQ